MAVIAVAVTDTGEETLHWKIPPGELINRTPIPRGRRIYTGSAAVAALGAGDETNVDITFTFPTAFVYLPKALTISFMSDDLTTEFSNFGVLQYDSALFHQYAMVCDGPAFHVAVRSVQTYRPQGTWKRWIDGTAAGVIDLLLADISGDASTAGDVFWSAEFWEYDVEQCLNWPVNTPQPVFTY